MYYNGHDYTKPYASVGSQLWEEIVKLPITHVVREYVTYRVAQKKGYRNCKKMIWDKFDTNTMKHTINRSMSV